MLQKSIDGTLARTLRLDCEAQTCVSACPYLGRHAVTHGHCQVRHGKGRGRGERGRGARVARYWKDSTSRPPRMVRDQNKSSTKVCLRVARTTTTKQQTQQVARPKAERANRHFHAS